MGIFILVLVQTSATVGDAGGAGTPGGEGVACPGRTGGAGAAWPGRAGGAGIAGLLIPGGGGKVICLPSTSWPSIMLLPRSLTSIGGAPAGAEGRPRFGIPGVGAARELDGGAGITW